MVIREKEGLAGIQCRLIVDHLATFAGQMPTPGFETDPFQLKTNLLNLSLKHADRIHTQAHFFLTAVRPMEP